MAERLSLVVQLFVAPESAADFEVFEAQAERLMARHGGLIERRIVLSGNASDVPDEVHLVSFPDQESFERYRADPDVEALSPLRQRVIRRTVIWSGREADDRDRGVGDLAGSSNGH